MAWYVLYKIRHPPLIVLEWLKLQWLFLKTILNRKTANINVKNRVYIHRVREKRGPDSYPGQCECILAQLDAVFCTPVSNAVYRDQVLQNEPPRSHNLLARWRQT